MKVYYKELGTETTEVEVISINGEASTNSYIDYDAMVDDLGAGEYILCS